MEPIIVNLPFIILSTLLRLFICITKPNYTIAIDIPIGLLISERFMDQNLRQYAGSLLIFIITGVIMLILLYKINNYLYIFVFSCEIIVI